MRLTRVALPAWAVLLAVVTGCTAPGPVGTGLGGLFGRAPTAADVIRVAPADGSRAVRSGSALRVRVADGRLESVRVVRDQGGRRTPVPGHLSADALTWEPDDPRLAFAARYTVEAAALDAQGRHWARHTAFTTYVPARRFVADVLPGDRTTVGTGMIVSLAFSREIRERAVVERAVRVTARPAVEIRPHWFGTDRLDFRPRHYWRPGTRVTVALRFNGIEGAPGVYGLQERTYSFTVGRSQTALVDAADHTMEVRRDGVLLDTLPITAGAPKTATYNGKMVVMEKERVTRMDGRTVGFGRAYDIKDVPHAMRLTDSGTFLHGNYWAPEAFGHENVSHGCVGLRDVKGGGPDTPAGWFFDRSLIGDVIEVVNSDDRTVAPGNGLGGWNMGWTEWKAGGAADRA
ncbi:Ig-like domain-containing protein [Streptomyces sp. NPDC047000]|uniref:L,D-transpeptidase n=1 Tax=Streptomyces sp. NPDC047000 TaxID=3155474 RepID=UPI0033EB5687